MDFNKELKNRLEKRAYNKAGNRGSRKMIKQAMQKRAYPYGSADEEEILRRLRSINDRPENMENAEEQNRDDKRSALRNILTAAVIAGGAGAGAYGLSKMTQSEDPVETSTLGHGLMSRNPSPGRDQ